MTTDRHPSIHEKTHENRMKTCALIFWRAANRFSEDGGFANASNIALSLLLSLFPFLMLVTALIRILGDPDLVDTVVNLLLGHWPANTAEPIATQVKIIISQNPGEFFSLSTLVALILAGNGVENARDGLNRAYKAKETRPFFIRRLQGILFVVIGAFSLIATAFVLVGTPLVWGFLIETLPLLQRFAFTVGLTQYVTAVCVLAISLFAFHRILPAGKRASASLVWGIGVTIVGILVGSKLFAFYLSTFANYTALYAGLAGTMVAIFYLYGISILLLFGAEINKVIDDYKKQPSSLSQPSKPEQMT